jgi:beta-carotene hydroxylase
MAPRFSKDYRTLLWAFVFFPGVPLVGITNPSLAPYLVPLTLYLAYSAGVLTHNHLHCPVFSRRSSNAGYAVWLSVFYGLPVFSWIPTHNQNHHRFVNSKDDVTHTFRHSRDNTLLNALLYPLRSGRWHLPLLLRFVNEARRRSGRLFLQLVLQSVSIPVVHGTCAALAVAEHGLGLGLSTYALSMGIPALLAPYFMMFTNYAQHIHCDPASADNHSRNFVSPWVNWLMFDAGYHTVHHENSGTHWSEYAALHRARAAAIDPALNEHSLLTFCLKNYVFGRLLPHLRTRDLSATSLTAQADRGGDRGLGEHRELLVVPK